MSGAVRIGGDPTDEEAAAIVAAVSAFMSGGAAHGDLRPSVYRSPWRIAALQQAADRAPLLYAFAEATVPKLTIITRKAYGGAYDLSLIHISEPTRPY